VDSMINKCPSVDECSQNAKVFEDKKHVAYACWYPQMGGYVGKCVAIFDKDWKQIGERLAIGGCVNVLVWHDGEFPFDDINDNPRQLHHCDPEDFIKFGSFLKKINNGLCVKISKEKP